MRRISIFEVPAIPEERTMSEQGFTSSDSNLEFGQSTPSASPLINSSLPEERTVSEQEFTSSDSNVEYARTTSTTLSVMDPSMLEESDEDFTSTNPTLDYAQDNSTSSSMISLSRPVSNYDPRIDATDVSILQHAYEEACNVNHKELIFLRLFRRFSYVYGHSIKHPSLREAVLLYCRGIWDDTWGSCEEIIKQDSRAFHAMQVRLNEPATVNEGDLFAAFLLAHHHLRSNEYSEGMENVRGLFTLMGYLYDSAGRSLSGFELRTLWSLARDYVTGWFVHKGKWWLAHSPEYARVLGCSNVQECQDYHHQLEIPFGSREKRQWSWKYAARHFLHLKSLYPSFAGNGSYETRQSVYSQLVDIQDYLNQLDEEEEYYLLRSDPLAKWKSREDGYQLGPFLYLFCYHLCRLMLSVLLKPSDRGYSKHSRIMAANQFLKSFNEIEYIVDRCQFLPVNEDSFFTAGESESTWETSQLRYGAGRHPQDVTRH